MKNGWIKIYRKLKEKGYYKDSEYVHLWVHILIEANHKTNEFFWNNKNVKVKSGEFITGRKKLAKDTGINESKIERILKCLESEHQIEQQPTTKFRLIKVKNWNKYQSKVNNKRTTSEQQVNTNKNDKNEKNYSKFKNLFTFKDGTKGFIDKRDGKLKELNTFKILGNIYKKELKKYERTK